jgi:hypothetical protein
MSPHRNEEQTLPKPSKKLQKLFMMVGRGNGKTEMQREFVKRVLKEHPESEVIIYGGTQGQRSSL